MSCLPESKLAREAEIAYMMICMSTDYDCWHSETEAVTVEMVMGNMAANSVNAKHVAGAILDSLGEEAHHDLVRGKAWEGQSKWGISGTSKESDVRAKMVDKIEWLFPGYVK